MKKLFGFCIDDDDMDHAHRSAENSQLIALVSLVIVAVAFLGAAAFEVGKRYGVAEGIHSALERVRTDYPAFHGWKGDQ